MSFGRDASLSPVLSKITKNRGIQDEEFKCGTDGKMETRAIRPFRLLQIFGTLGVMTHL